MKKSACFLVVFLSFFSISAYAQSPYGKIVFEKDSFTIPLNTGAGPIDSVTVYDACGRQLTELKDYMVDYVRGEVIPNPALGSLGKALQVTVYFKSPQDIRENKTITLNSHPLLINPAQHPSLWDYEQKCKPQ